MIMSSSLLASHRELESEREFSSLCDHQDSAKNNSLRQTLNSIATVSSGKLHHQPQISRPVWLNK